MNEKIVIKNGDLVATAETLGAQLRSLKKGDKEYIWCGNPDFWKDSCPVLFPVAGGLKEDKYILDGKEYYQRKHGFAKKQEFKVFDKKENEVTFLLTENEETLTGFPFKFKFFVKYTLTNVLKIEYKVENVDEKTMYFTTGGHEGYAVDKNFEDWTIEFEKAEDLNSYILDGNLLEHNYINYGKNTKELPLKYEYFAVDALVFKDIVSRKVWLKHKADGKRLSVEFNDFNHLVLWTKPNAPYICIEPWISVQDFVDSNMQIKDKLNVVKLEGGNSKAFTHTVEVF